MSISLEKVQSFVKSGTSPSSIHKAYDTWAKEGSYDEDMAAVSSRGPVILADVFESCYPENRAPLHIIDVAAGTGRGGEQLFDRGFTTIDALDPSQEMLNIAKAKNIYQKLICASLGDKSVDIPEDTYDAVSCVGGLAEGHLPAESVLEMIRLVKTDGLVIMVSNGKTWNSSSEYHDKMTGLINDSVHNGEIKVVRKEFIDGYRMCAPDECAKAIVIVLQKSK